MALSPDGATLLVGAIDRDCVTLEGRVRCGTAYLYHRGSQGWTLASRLQRPPDAGLGAQFGQTLALLPDGAALVGGTGIIADAGALHLFLPDGRYAQSLLPPGGDQFYATEIATSGDGTWLAVGAAQSVVLYRRNDDRFEPAQTLTAPEDNAGHFGEAVAIDATGRELIVGAPRAACPAGQRCESSTATGGTETLGSSPARSAPPARRRTPGSATSWRSAAPVPCWRSRAAAWS